MLSVTLHPSPTDMEKFHHAASDWTLASAAADALIDAVSGGEPVQYYVSAVQSGVGQPVPWPGHLHLGWTNARGDRGMRTKRRATAKGWMITAYRAGLSVQLHGGPEACPLTLGTLKQIRERYGLSSAQHLQTVAMLPQVFEQHVKDMSPADPVSNYTKAVGGEHTLGEVRNKVHAVVSALSKDDARAILCRHGDGASRVNELRPEHYDAVYRACDKMLNPHQSEPPPKRDCNDPRYVAMRAAIRKVAEQINKETALGILRDWAGVHMITAVQPHHCDGVTAACENELRGVHEPSNHTYSTAFGVEHRTFAITAFPNQPAGSAVLTSDCPATGEHSVIAVFNNRAQAEAIKNLLSTSARLTATK